jgi:hypothetical protein
MKKVRQILNLLTTAIIAIALTTSCGGGRKQNAIAKVKPEKVEISGDLSDYLQVVDNEYEITDDWGGHLSIKVKALKSLSADELKNNSFQLSASLLGDNGMPVSGTGNFNIEYSSKDKLMSLLKKGSGEEVIQLKAGLGDYKAEEHAVKSKKFSVTSTMKEKEEETETASSSSENSSSSDENVSSSGSSEDFDKILDDYEELVNEYIKFYKKAMKGDQEALSEYPSLMEKATNLSESMEKAQNNNQLTAKQINRMVKISTKMAQAALNN